MRPFTMLGMTQWHEKKSLDHHVDTSRIKPHFVEICWDVFSSWAPNSSLTQSVMHGLACLHVVAPDSSNFAAIMPRPTDVAQDRSVALERAVKCQVGVQPTHAPLHQFQPTLRASFMVSDIPHP